MFTKLLKHEFKAQRGLLSFLSLAALGAGLLGGLMMWIFTSSDLIYGTAYAEQEFASAMLLSLSMTVMVGAIFAIIAYMVSVWILLLYRFYKHHFSDEGYLTFTLPATTHQILLSSILNIVIWSVICIIVTVLAFLMIFTPVIQLAIREMQNIMDFPFQFGDYLFADLDVGYYALQIFSMLSSAVYSLMIPLLSITLGALAAKKHKILAAFGIYYGLSAAISIITSILQVASLMSDSILSTGEDSLYLIFSSLIPSLLYLGIGIGGYFLMHSLVKKKLNLP